MNQRVTLPTFPVNPAPGTFWQGWVWNGTNWVCQGGGPMAFIRVFLASGSYFPSAGLSFAMVECIGPGGGGGWVGTFPGGFGAAGGGGSGGLSRKLCPAALVAGGVPVTVGLGGMLPVGSAGPSGNPPWPPNTFNGDTTFGALCIAHGGQNAWPCSPAGAPASVGQNGDAGNGALIGVGDVTWPGASGYRPSSIIVPQATPIGTLTPFSQGGMGGTVVGGSNITPNELGSNDGQPGYHNTGSGGSGAESNYEAGTVQRPGGRGSDGICVITEFCFGPINSGCWDPCSGMGARVTTPPGGWTEGFDYGD
jgi:hypothetical protein